MFTLCILASRYIFVFYILYFLWQSVLYVLEERGIIADPHGEGRQRAVFRQRVCIILMHIIAYLIVSYIPESVSFNKEIILCGLLGLAFFLAAWLLTSIIYRKSCPLMWNAIFFLMDAGLIMLQRIEGASAMRQLMWFGIGLATMLIIPLFLKIIPKFEKLEYIYLAVALVFIVSPFFLGERIGGAVNWIQVAGFTFQPSEIVKFLFVFYLASVLRKKSDLKRIIILTACAAAFVCILVLQKDLGGALIFFMTYLVILYIATGNLWLFIGGFSAASVASVVAYQFFSHIRVRVAAWQDPFSDIAVGGYQIAQSLFAIGTWGIFGSGLTRGTPDSIPVVTSDFIFAAICEEMGIIFAAALIGVMLVIFYRGVHFALRCQRRYYGLLAAGFTGMLAFQSFLIIGGNIKLIPLTGVTLPFISYGGSSILVSMLMAGILQWIFAYYANTEKGGGLL